jgi:hypothetical protein
MKTIPAQAARSKPDHYIPEDVLRHLEGTALFYPHSMRDLLVPVTMFAPWISDFWFVDIGYFGPEHPADKADYAFASSTLFQPVRFTLDGPPVDPFGRTAGDIEPCVRTETYLHNATGKEFRVHRRRGYSVSGFRKERFKLGVFFYRGDSDEGSSTPWLAVRNAARGTGFIFEVLDRLVDGGLMVVDGSRCTGRNNPYVELKRFFWTDTPGRDAMRQAQPFVDPQGRAFRCVGHAGPRNGPTLAWQVTQPAKTAGGIG